ncbi:MAG: acyltransferase family protein [Lachnotalea sp.]
MNNKLQVKNRIGWIDIAKAIGILVVLINHAELHLGFVTFLGGMFYMPVFFVLSGYTFKNHSEESIRSFIMNKAKRLLVPYACFQVVLIGLFTMINVIKRQSVGQILYSIVGAVYSRNTLFAKASDTLVTVPTNTIDLMTGLSGPLWFLTALFVTLVIYKFILTVSNGSAKREWLYLGISIFIGIMFKYMCPILLPWSIDSAFVSVGFIHCGRMMKKENIIQKLYRAPHYILGIIAVFVVLSYINGIVNMSIRDFGKSVLIYLVVGSVGSLLVMLISKAIEEYTKIINQILEMIGRHTIGILAFHLIIFGIIQSVFVILQLSDGMIEKSIKIIASVVILVPTDWFIQKNLPFVYGIMRRSE